jgi:hypothetical protein
MANRALITPRRVAGVEDDETTTGDKARGLGFVVEHDVSGGSIVNLENDEQ